MKWEYFGTGLAFLGIGITMVLALPPPWWPSMPRLLIRTGLFLGLALIIYGVAFTAMGIWPDILRPRVWPIVGIAFGVFVTTSSVLWLIDTPTGHKTGKSEKEAPKSEETRPAESDTPASLEELFKTDFERTMRTHNELTLSAPGDVTDKIMIQIYYDMDSGTYFIGFYVPMSPRTADIVQYLADGHLSPSLQLRQGIEVISRDPADTTSLKFSEFTFSRRIYIYHETELSIQDIAALDTLYRSKKLILQLRGRQYQTTRWLQKSAIKK